MVISRPMHGLELARRPGVERHSAPARPAPRRPPLSGIAARRSTPACRRRGAQRRQTNMMLTRRHHRPAVERLAAARARRQRRIHALQPQQPELEVPRQRLDRRAAGAARRSSTTPSRYSRSSACASGAHSSISSAKYSDVPERRPRRSACADDGQRAALRLDVVDPHQLALLALVVRDAGPRHRLERADEPRSRPPRALGDAALLAAIARQEHHDPIGFAQLVGAQDQRVGGVDAASADHVYLTPSAAPGTSGTPSPARGTRRSRTRRSAS